ncbi:MAG: chloride channel protein [Phycisphaerales bacterium]|nr:chloride channel protein [Phycisphaerales bacterium]
MRRIELSQLVKMDWRARHLLRVVTLSAIVGILAGLSARLIAYLLALGTSHIVDRFPQGQAYEIGAFSWMRLLIPAVGGLLCGLVLYKLLKLSPRQGTESVIHAFHHEKSVMPLHVSLVKGLAAVGVIACGGSVGPEGPVAALGGGIGSTFGRRFGLSARSTREYLIAGCAGGVGAIFQCPLGGALFAATLMYRQPEFESKSLLKALICSVIAYAVFIAFREEGERLLHNANELSLHSPGDLIWFFMLGLACAAATAILWASLRITEAVRIRSSIPLWIWPAIGGLAVGAIACAVPQIMDWHYHLVQSAMDGQVADIRLFELDQPQWIHWIILFTGVVIAKCIATGITVGSANAGGLLGPSLFIGGMTGASLGALLKILFGDLISDELYASLIPIGMAGFLSASMRSPLASIVMVLEMTGSYELIVPSMLACVTAYIFGQSFGLNNEQLRSSTESPAHSAEPVLDLLEAIRIDEVMDDPLEHIAVPTTPWPEIIRRLGSMPYPILYVVRDRRILGQIRVSELQADDSDPFFREMIIAEDVMTALDTRLSPSMPLLEASRRFAVAHASILPVVDERSVDRIVGVLNRAQIHRVLRDRLAGARDLAMREEGALRALEGEDHLFHLAQGMSSGVSLKIREIPVPDDVAGTSLRDSGFRAKYALEVLGIRSADGSQRIPADPTCVLNRTDLLIVIPHSSDAPASP